MPAQPDFADPRIAEAAALFQRAATAAPSKGYQLLYFTVKGCGDSHNYDNLRRLEKSGVPVVYVNLFHPNETFVEKGVQAPGRSLNVPAAKGMFDFSARKPTVNDAINFLASKQLDMSEVPHAVLLDARGNFVREFDSTTSPTFLRDVQRYTNPAMPTPVARGNSRT